MPRPGPVILALLAALALVALAAVADLGMALLHPLAPHLDWLFPDPSPHPSGEALMIPQFGHTLAQACHVIGLLMELAGGLLIALSLLGGGGSMGLIRGGALLVFGAWFAGLAG